MFWFNKTPKQEKLSPIMDFEKDFAPLLFFINTKIDLVKFTLGLHPEKKIITDDEIKTTTEEIALEVINGLSQHYIDNVLSKYISKEFQQVYIVEIITKKMVELGYNKNIGKRII